MTDYEDRNAQFRADIAEVIARHWDAITVDSDDDEVDPIEIAEMGATYPSGWIVLAVASSIDNPRAGHTLTWSTADGQSPYTSIGILYEALQRLVAL